MVETVYHEAYELLTDAESKIREAKNKVGYGQRNDKNLEMALARVDKVIEWTRGIINHAENVGERAEVRKMITDATPEQLEKIKALLS